MTRHERESGSQRRAVLACVAATVAAALVTGASPPARTPAKAPPPPVMFPSISLEDEPWKLQSTGDGISLYHSEVKRGGVVPVKFTMTIPGTIAEVSLVLEDIPRRREWVNNLDQSVLLERASDYDQIEYLRVDVPWPVSDRSAVIRALITVSDDLREATITAKSVEHPVPDSLPELVRAHVHESTFHMTQVGDHVEVVSYVFIDPAGSIPTWIVNFFSRRVARATLVGLRRQVARKLYAAAQIQAMDQRIHRYREHQLRQGADP